MVKKITDQEVLLLLLKELEQQLPLTELKIKSLQKKHALANGAMLSKTDIIAGYKKLAGTHNLQPFKKEVVEQLRMKPTRTVSGLAPVTVLTKPFPCPGNCLFCPSDVRMPKSYLASEPGAQRAEHNYFDPYLQTYNRLQALYDMGHPVDKVELIVLGGSWSAYPLPYQIWFIKECFRAMNEFRKMDDRERLQSNYQEIEQEIAKLNLPAFSADSDKNEQIFSKYQPQGSATEENTYNSLMTKLFIEPEKIVGLAQFQTANWSELLAQQQLNEQTQYRCVGLVLETRPDLITESEVIRLRKLGCTKVQLGLQSLNDEVLVKNQRGHSVAQSAQALKLLRQAGFKLHVHWMPNLYGSTVEQDKQDYLKLFSDPKFCPDEIKIYPCSLIESAPLMKYFASHKWQPYSYDELLDILSFCLLNTPPYCRITRVIRDIPSFEIVAGNKKSNFRQLAQQKLDETDQQSHNIRAREIRHQEFNAQEIYLDELEYQVDGAREIFLQYLVPVAGVPKLLGFLRLNLPADYIFREKLLGKKCAMIREIHVYGQLVSLGQDAMGDAQHLGIGTKLIARAKKIAQTQGYKNLAVISAVGTREYYRQRGFADQELYQVAELSSSS